MEHKRQGFVVFLDDEVKESQLENIQHAIQFVKGVTQVTSISDSAIERRIKSEVLESLWSWCQENLK